MHKHPNHSFVISDGLPQRMLLNSSILFLNLSSVCDLIFHFFAVNLVLFAHLHHEHESAVSLNSRKEQGEFLGDGPPSLWGMARMRRGGSASFFFGRQNGSFSSPSSEAILSIVPSWSTDSSGLGSSVTTAKRKGSPPGWNFRHLRFRSSPSP